MPACLPSYTPMRRDISFIDGAFKRKNIKLNVLAIIENLEKWKYT